MNRTQKHLSQALLLLLALVVAALGVPLQAQSSQPLRGQWLISPSDKTGQVQFTFSYSRTQREHSFNSTNSDNMAISELVGLTPENLQANGAHVQFKIVRPAGAFACEGWMRKGEGSGHFDFAPDRNFAAQLKQRGIGEASDEQLMRLAFANTSLAFIDEMKGRGYSLNMDQLIRVSTHGVTPQYLHDLQAVGIKPSSVEKLVRLRDHGVDAAYVKEMMALGYKGFDEEQLVRLYDHGVHPDFVREMRGAGFNDLGAEELTRMKDHGVSAEFVKEVRKGYSSISAQELVRMKDHGVTANYLLANIKGRSVDEVIRMHDRGGDKD